jgi:predicted PurR-regulated permease PerM
MSLPGNEVHTQTQVLDDPRESAKVTSRARLRITELLQKPFDVRSIALTGLFILAILYTMYFMRSVLLPIVLALLLSYLLRPIIRALARLKIPSLISSALVLIALLALVTYGLSSLVTPLAGWLQKAPTGFAELQHKLMPVKQSLAQVAQASGQIEKLAAAESQTAPKVEVQHHPITDMLFVRTPEFIASAVLLLVLLYFLLAYDGVFMSKLIKLLPTLSDKKRAVSIVVDIESHVSR